METEEGGAAIKSIKTDTAVVPALFAVMAFKRPLIFIKPSGANVYYLI